MSQANVRSHEAIKEFKLALIAFGEDARNALDAVEMEIRQTRNWLERDQLAYWKSQVKRCHEQVAEARTELHRRQLTQMNSDAVSDSDQRDALRHAKRRLEEAEQKVATIKKWSPILDHAVSEYHSQSQPLGDRLSGRFVASLVLLDRMIQALEAYLALQAPSALFQPPASVAAEAASETGEPARAPASAPAPPPPPAEAVERPEETTVAGPP